MMQKWRDNLEHMLDGSKLNKFMNMSFIINFVVNMDYLSFDNLSYKSCTFPLVM